MDPGFKPPSLLASFLGESAFIALLGAIVGCLIALLVNGIVASTSNWTSFNEVTFSFRVTPGLLFAGLFAVVMGLVGGFFPARRAAMLPVIQALRE